jgi:hypothetical protein
MKPGFDRAIPASPRPPVGVEACEVAGCLKAASHCFPETIAGHKKALRFVLSKGEKLHLFRIRLPELHRVIAAMGVERAELGEGCGNFVTQR